MTAKKSLESRIRGWLPKEPKPYAAPINLNFRTNTPFNNPKFLGKGNIRTINSIILLSSIFIASLVIAMVLFAMVGIYFLALALGFGFVFGLVSGVLITPRIIKRTEHHQDSWGLKEFLILTPAAIFFLLILYSSIFAGFYVGGLAITFWLTQLIILVKYERKNKVFIIQSGWTGTLFSIVPQGAPRYPVQGNSENTMVSQKVKWSTRLGFSGGFFFVLFSILQLSNYNGGLFYWNATLVTGSIILFSVLIGFVTGFLGAYGSFIGKKKGGFIMVASGILGLICSPFYGVVFGSLLIVGGTLACLERPRMIPTEG